MNTSPFILLIIFLFIVLALYFLIKIVVKALYSHFTSYPKQEIGQNIFIPIAIKDEISLISDDDDLDSLDIVTDPAFSYLECNIYHQHDD